MPIVASQYISREGHGSCEACDCVFSLGCFDWRCWEEREEEMVWLAGQQWLARAPSWWEKEGDIHGRWYWVSSIQSVPFDFIWTGGLNVIRLFDYSAIALVVILHFVGVYRRRRLTQRVRHLAAFHL
ncbi:hypothetical protein L1049_015967 [Liquidambar formosana]|uniref:Uncharacterized protein n=1 Tax=Liquidambar formosana TaxID=63359 RepID=A0AAP0X2V0_LIQFO